MLINYYIFKPDLDYLDTAICLAKTEAGCWELARIQSDLLMPLGKTSGREDDSSNTFFIETVFGEHAPQTVCVNPEPTIIDVKQILMVKEETTKDQKPNVDLHDPKPHHIKEEEERVCISQGVELRNVKEEIESAIKSEDDKQSPLLSHLYQDQIKDREPPEENNGQESIKTEDYGDGCNSLECEGTKKDEEDDDVELKPLSDYGLKTKDIDRDPKLDGELNKPNSEIGSPRLIVIKKCFTQNRNGSSQRKIKTGEKFSCEDCGKTFIKKHNLNIHMRIHTRQKPFCCDLCGCRFTDESRLNKHTRIHTRQKRLCCEICGHRFNQKQHLNTHMRIHTGEKPFSCDICGRKFSDKSNRNKHRKIHTRQKISFCDLKQDRSLSVVNSVDTNVLEIESAIKSGDDKVSPLLSQFYQDQNKDGELPERNNGGESIKTEYNQCGSRSLECEDIKKDEEDDDVDLKPLSDSGLKTKGMDRDPKSEGELNKPNSEIGSPGLMDMKECLTESKNFNSRRKVKTGNKFSCEVCGKTLTKKHNLSIHMRIHTGEKPFCCDLCGHRFNQKSNLNTHMRIHTDEKSFCCHLCGRRFTDESRLNNHTRIHTGQKPFCCDLCGDRFNEKSSLSKHTKIHTRQKPFCWDVCGNKLCRKAHLDSHVRIHTRQKPFCCDLCGHRFTEKSSLKRHMRRHTEQKTLCCVLCGHRFNQKQHLKTHMRIHTSQRPFCCDICGRKFSDKSNRNKHMKIHTRQKISFCDLKQDRSLSVVNSVDTNVLEIESAIKSGDDKVSPLLSQFYQDQNKDEELPEKNNGGESVKTEYNQCGSRSLECEDIKKDEEDDDVDLKPLSDSGLKTKGMDRDPKSEGELNKPNSEMGSPGLMDMKECLTESKSFNSRRKVKTGNKFSCEVCGKTLTKKHNLNTHMRIHTGEKPFCCDICGCKFSDKSNRNKHMKIHTRQKISFCDLKQDRSLSVVNSVDIDLTKNQI